jgi:hypothetical protein
MSPAKFALGLTVSILGLSLPQSVAATSIVAIRPHDPAHACPAIKEAIAQMTGQSPSPGYWPIFYTDKFGIVEYDELADFVASMTSSQGRADKSPIELSSVWPVARQTADKTPDKTRALYVIRLERNQWHNERESSFDPMHIEPEGFEPTPSYWLLEFAGDRIIEAREGFVFFNFVDYDKRLKACGRYGD